MCVAVATAKDYSYQVNEDGNGGAYAVESGANKVVTEDCTYDNVYSVEQGGAIYVGESAHLELQGNHTFSNNAQLAWETGHGTWYGDFNDIYLAGGATLTLNPQDSGDVILLGSGLCAEEGGNTTVVKQGAGKLIFGEQGENSDMCSDLDVQQGTVEMRCDVLTNSLSIASQASVNVASPDSDKVIALHVGSMEGMNLSFNFNKVEIRLSGVTVTESSISSEGEQKGVICGAVIGSAYSESMISVTNVSLTDTDIRAEAPLTLCDISMDADSSIHSSESYQTLLQGDNIVELNSLTSTQLQGVTLADGATLTLTLSEDLLSGVGEDFNIILEDLSLAENAVVTLNVKMADGATNSVTMSGYTQESGGVKIKMSGAATVPEPTTATLSLLALVALSARRRRSA